jgi:TolB protein
VSERDGNQDVFVVNADGSGLVNLSLDPSRDLSPAWSPAGDHIAFVSDRSGTRDIFTINADGTGLVSIATDSRAQEDDPVWRPSQ